MSGRCFLLLASAAAGLLIPAGCSVLDPTNNERRIPYAALVGTIWSGHESGSNEQYEWHFYEDSCILYKDVFSRTVQASPMVQNGGAVNWYREYSVKGSDTILIDEYTDNNWIAPGLYTRPAVDSMVPHRDTVCNLETYRDGSYYRTREVCTPMIGYTSPRFSGVSYFAVGDTVSADLDTAWHTCYSSTRKDTVLIERVRTEGGIVFDSLQLISRFRYVLKMLEKDKEYTEPATGAELLYFSVQNKLYNGAAPVYDWSLYQDWFVWEHTADSLCMGVIDRDLQEQWYWVWQREAPVKIKYTWM